MSEHPSPRLLQRLGSGEILVEDPVRDAHIERCELCGDAVEAWARLARHLDAMASPEPGPDFAAAVLARCPEPGAEVEAPAVPADSLRRWALGILAASLATGLLAVFDLDFLIDLPALLARDLGVAGTLMASALTVADTLAAALPESISLGLLIAVSLCFLGLARLLPDLSLSELEEIS